jgi:arylsulfatase
MANDGQDRRCVVLPIPGRMDTGATTCDAKDPDTNYPQIELLRPSSDAPSVLLVRLDNVGFGSRC